MAIDLIARALAKAAAGGGGSGAVGWITPSSGEIVPLFTGQLGGSNTAVANRIFLAPILSPRTISLAGLVSRLNTIGSGSTAKFVLYNASQTTHKPTTVKAETNLIDVSTVASGNNKSANFATGNQTIVADTLYFAGVFQGDAQQVWQGLSQNSSYAQRLAPQTLANLTTGNAEMSNQWTYNATFGSAAPDLSATSSLFAQASGQNGIPAMWGLIA